MFCCARHNTQHSHPQLSQAHQQTRWALCNTQVQQLGCAAVCVVGMCNTGSLKQALTKNKLQATPTLYVDKGLSLVLGAAA